LSFLFIGTTGDHAGHRFFTWAIARRLVEKGLSVGFLKPFGTHPVKLDRFWMDQDAVLFIPFFLTVLSSETVSKGLFSTECPR